MFLWMRAMLVNIFPNNANVSKDEALLVSTLTCHSLNFFLSYKNICFFKHGIVFMTYQYLPL